MNNGEKILLVKHLSFKMINIIAYYTIINLFLF